MWTHDLFCDYFSLLAFDIVDKECYKWTGRDAVEVIIKNERLCLYVVANFTLGSLRKQARRRKQERHQKMLLRVSATIYRLFHVIMLAKFSPTILELNWYRWFGN